MPSRLAAFVLALAAGTGLAQAALGPEDIELQDGWIEAVAIVREAGRVDAFFRNTAGYERIHAGRLGPEVIAAWNLDPQVSGQEWLYREPGAARGFVRVIVLAGIADQGEARPAGQFHDTGGIAGMNVRVHDIDAAYARMQAAGWRAFAPVVRFSVEGFRVAEAVFAGPDGLVIGLIERQAPPLGPEWAMHEAALSRPNNAFVLSGDLPASLASFAATGWQPFLRDEGPAAPEGPNLYGWPHELPARVSREVVWVHPHKGGEGSVALMSLKGVSGRDFSASAGPPHYGWVVLRRLSDAPAPADASTPYVQPPYGCVRLAAVTGPEGVRRETFHRVDAC
jgi:hypothetical protein